MTELFEIREAALEVKRARAAFRAAQREFHEADAELKRLWREWMEGLHDDT